MQDLEGVVKKVKSEIKGWKNFLNNIIGILSFSLALGCLGTSKPTLYAMISFGFMMIVSIANRHLFPKTIKRLREKKKTKAEKALLKKLMRCFFSLAALFKDYPAYTFGMLFLAIVAFCYKYLQLLYKYL